MCYRAGPIDVQRYGKLATVLVRWVVVTFWGLRRICHDENIREETRDIYHAVCVGLGSVIWLEY